MEQPPKWYFRKSILAVAILSVGPLALPLLWINPYIGKKAKLIATVVILVLSYYGWILTLRSLEMVKDQYQALMQQM